MTESEKNKIFRASILFKAGIGIIEIIIGILFYTLDYETMQIIGDFIMHNELSENPQSVFWNLINSGIHDIIFYSKSLWAFLLIAHGGAKIFLIQGMLKKKIWAYILSIIVFTYFVIDQVSLILMNHSLPIILITIFDVAVIALIAQEYKKERKRKFSR